MECLPGWVISSMPGPPPRQNKHERHYTPSTHSVKPTRWIWNDDCDGQMIFGDLGGVKFPDICLTGEEKTPKKPHPGNLSRPGIEPGPATWQARMLPLAPQRWTYRLFHIKKTVLVLWRILLSQSEISVILFYDDCVNSHSTIVHRCEPGGSMRACHAAGPGSIPSRDKIPGWGFFGVFPHL